MDTRHSRGLTPGLRSRGRSKDVIVDVGKGYYDSPTGARAQSGWNMAGCVCATAIIAMLIAIAAIVLAIIAWNHYTHITATDVRQSSGVIRVSPTSTDLAASAAPIAMTLPNDMSDYVIGEEYAIFSTTAQPHTVTIAAGALTTTWDGANTVATFGGAKGDGFMFRVLASDLIVVTFVKNVAFS